MSRDKQARIVSILLVGVGVILFILNLVYHWEYNIALPLLFLVLGGGFFLVIVQIRDKWEWAVYLYIPGLLLATFGIIFLLNVLTSDWKSWAYAWLLFLAAIGIGLLLANREFKKSSLINLIGWGLSIAGFTFFVIFGAVAGGLFIEITAPVFLVGIGLLVYWLKPDFNTIAFHSKEQIGYRKASGAASLLEVDTFLAEPLSVREIEVLELINHGFSNAQIASRLTVAQSTVKTHINNIYTKMGVQSRVQAINKARALNLLDN